MGAAAMLTLAIIGRAATIGVGLLLLLAGLSQWRHRFLLPGVIANYRLLPDALVTPAALALPLAEALIGLGLIAGFTPLSAVAGIALLLLFAGAMAINIRRGRSHIDCGCGHSELRHPIGWSLVARNLLLAALLLPALAPTPSLNAMDLASALAAGLAILLLSFLFQSLGALAASPVHRR